MKEYKGYYISIEGKLETKIVQASSSREAYQILEQFAEVSTIYNVTTKS